MNNQAFVIAGFFIMFELEQLSIMLSLKVLLKEQQVSLSVFFCPNQNFQGLEFVVAFCICQNVPRI